MNGRREQIGAGGEGGGGQSPTNNRAGLAVFTSLASYHFQDPESVSAAVFSTTYINYSQLSVCHCITIHHYTLHQPGHYRPPHPGEYVG